MPRWPAAGGSAAGAGKFAAAAAVFAGDNPRPAGLFDLGEVPQAVGQAAGFGCLYQPAGPLDLGAPDTVAPTPGT